MRWTTALFAPLIAALAATPAAALVDDGGVVVVEYVAETVYYGLPDPAAPFAISSAGAQRFVTPEVRADMRWPVASYGPFRVFDDGTAALTGITDERSPAAFAAMLRDHPAIAVLEFHDCPGTYDDRANLRLGRMIRDAGLAVHVPADGSVRSGAVELVLAGSTVTIADGASFAVHAWLDDLGREAGDYAADSEEHRKYLAYYADVGMAADEAQAFYAMTNSASFDSALWLDGAEMRGWIRKAQGNAPFQAGQTVDVAQAEPADARLVTVLAAAGTSAQEMVVAEAAALVAEDDAAPAVSTPVVSAPVQIAYLDLNLLLN